MRLSALPSRLHAPIWPMRSPLCNAGLLHGELRSPARAALAQQLTAAVHQPARRCCLQSTHRGWGPQLLSQERRRAGQRRATLAAVPVVAAAAVAAPSLMSSLLPGMAVLVGWLVIAGSCIRSLPQIIRILKNKSTEGLSLISFASELCVYSIQVAYNMHYRYPFSTFGDTVMCWLQNVVIIALIFLHESIPGPVKGAVVLGIGALTTYLFSSWCSPGVLQALQASTVVILAVLGKIPQIAMNIKRGNSGQLSVLSTGLSFTGNIARVFTTLIMVKDSIILTNVGSQAVLNGILLLQTIATARRMRLADPQHAAPVSQLQPALQ